MAQSVEKHLFAPLKWFLLQNYKNIPVFWVVGLQGANRIRQQAMFMAMQPAKNGL